MICSCSGPQAALLSSMGNVIQAWASHVNGAGGINGHPVNVIVKDDSSNPATGLQDAKELIAQDHVMAIVGEVSLVDGSWASYVSAQGVPVIGGISSEASFLTNPDFYPSGSQLLVQVAGTMALAKGAGKSHVGVLYCAESPVCAQLIPIADALGKLNGLQISTAKISSTSPSYAAPCLTQKGQGVTAQFIAENAPVVQRVVAACAQQGYKPLQANVSTTASSAWLTDPNFTGALLSGTNANPYDTSLPATAALQAALKKYDPGLISGGQLPYDVILPWSGGALFAAAAEAGHITPSSTPADVKQGLYALKNETLGGLSSPLNFMAGKPAFVPCYFTQTIKGGKFLSLNENKPTCLSAASASALAKALAG
jgi:branched-chain amino acid transport system substrate-binding protein